MRVVATQRGYYGDLREAGDEFTISGDEAFSEVWMQRIEDEKPRRGRPPKSEE